MPVATIDPGKFERFELKTLEGAYIMARALPFGMKLERREKASKMFVEAGGPRRNRNQGGEQTQRFELENLQKWATLFDFKYCIGEHNLTDQNDNLLDLSSPMTMQILDPRVGSEIERILSEINDEGEEELEPFMMPVSSISQDDQSPILTPSET